jgi:putative endonuclease
MDTNSNTFNNATNTREKGHTAETMAEEFLKAKGYEIVKRNFHFGKVGEIDLICKDKGILVFVEVKARSSRKYGEAIEAVDYRKQRQIRKVAEAYYYVNKINNQESRFDIVTIDFTVQPPLFDHIINCIF